MEDREIIDLFWARSDNAIRQAAEKYGPYCHYIAYHILGNPEDTEECVNDTWLHAWNAIPPAKPQVLSTFLGRLTRNLALDRHREESAQKRGGGQVDAALEELAECLPQSRSPEEQTIDKIVLADALAEFLDEQKKMDRIIFVKRYWYLATVAEIAKELGFTQSRIKMSLHRTRAALAKRLEREGIAL